MSDQRAGRLWRLAVAGNAAALVVVALILAGGPSLLGPPAGEAPAGREAARPLPATVGGPAERVLMVVVDGLRDDVSRDPARMPGLVRLAASGGRGTARVMALVPSTVAGIVSLVTGALPAPASFLDDFRARPAAEGGLVAAVAAAAEAGSGGVFVAGPRLWTDLYGRWIGGAEIVPGVGADDERVLAAARAALARGEARLVVAHFGRTDDAAHLHGTASAEYAAAAAWCDAALSELAARAGGATAVLVTSDHGATTGGGHAGPEPGAVVTPLVVAGPGMPRGELGELRQGDLRHLVLGALGLPGGLGAGASAPASRSIARDLARAALVALAALLCALRVWGVLIRGGLARRQAVVLDAALWVALAVAMIVSPEAGLLVILAALAWAAAGARGGGHSPTSAGEGLVVVAVVAGGALTGLLRLGEALASGFGVAGAGFWGPGLLALPPLALVAIRRALVVRSDEAEPPLAPGLPGPRRLWPSVAGAVGLGGLALALGGWSLLAIVAAAAVVGALAVGRPVVGVASCGAAVAAGVALALSYPLVARLAGETASLSTLDVRAAFALADGPLGLAAAVGAAFLRLALPALGLLAGAATSLRSVPAGRFGAVAAGMAAALAGQAAVAALVLPASGVEQAPAAVALGLLLRSLAEICVFFLGGALILAPRVGPASR